MGIGYNFTTGIGTSKDYVENMDSSYSTHYSRGSYGKGADISLGFGRMMSKNFGMELGIGVIIGAKNKENNQYLVSYNGISGIDQQSKYYLANTFKFNPKIVIEVPLKNEHAFYGKIGYVFGFGNTKIHADEITNYSTGEVDNGTYEWAYKGGFVSGSTTSLGFKLKAEKDAFFFIELTSENLSRKFKKGSMTYSVENGQNTLNSRSVSSKEILFEDKVTTDPNGTPDQNQPKKYAAYRYNYSSVGFKIGFVANF